MKLAFDNDPDHRPFDNRPNGHPGPLLKISPDEVDELFNTPSLISEAASLVLSSANVIVADTDSGNS
ncbi:MAG TPA: hypothetical protein VLF39_03540 [Candidatus Saccharimonadales bacterium]|nr:hypothetical protein [Candidatus Saccharimonadales bacterium]